MTDVYVAMEFNAKQRHRPARSRTGVRAEEYSNSLQLYTIPPTETISLHEFEELAIDRLKGTFCTPGVKCESADVRICKMRIVMLVNMRIT